MSINSYSEMRKKSAEISRNLSDLMKVTDSISKMGISIDCKPLSVIKSKVENTSFKVLVIGEFKNGKSTFINALLGEKVLPAYSTPCTAVINEVVYGNTKDAELQFKNPLPKKISDMIPGKAKQHIAKYKNTYIPPLKINIADLEEYVTIPDDEEISDKIEKYIHESPYSKAMITYPIELCREGISIIDSPGLNENDTRTKVTEEYLNHADAILYVLACPKIAGQSDMDYINQRIRSRGYKDIFFICTHFDTVDEDEQDRLKRYAIKKLAPVTSFKDNGIFFVDSLHALKAKEKKSDQIVLEKTGIPQFEKSLSEYLRNTRGKTKLMNIVNPCITFSNDLLSRHINEYMSLLETDYNEAVKKINEAMPNLQAAHDRKKMIEIKIENETEELFKITKSMVEENYDSIMKKLPEFIDHMELKNKVKINPSKQKESKKALEEEFLLKTNLFLENEWWQWSNSKLNPYIDQQIERIEKDIGKDVDIFYANLDKFKLNISGIKTPNDISGFQRVVATIVGTAFGGPAYGAIGATMGFGELVKRSVITIGAAFALLMTPISVNAFMIVALIAMLTSGVAQTATAGHTLTQKYKNKLEKELKKELQKSKEENCKKYARNISDNVKTTLTKISDALEKEIRMEESKIEALNKDKEKSFEAKQKKLKQLEELNNKLSAIKTRFINLKIDIES